MSDAPVQPEAASVCVLEEITSVPLTFDRPLFRHYPGMKLGQRQPVEFFAHLLADLAAGVIQECPQAGALRRPSPARIRQGGSATLAGETDRNWVITAPAYLNLPSAANLLAWQVHRLLNERGVAVALHDLRLKQPDAPVRNGEEFGLISNYSKNSLQKRIELHAQMQSRLQTETLAACLGGRRVMVINDINVTGTTQQFLQHAFTEFGVHSCHWIYIFDVEKSLANRSPEIEHQINNSQFQSAAAFAKLLCDEQTHPTARCLSRLMAQELDDLRELVSMLDPGTCARLHGLALLEGRYGGPYFSDRLNYLATAGQPQCVS